MNTHEIIKKIAELLYKDEGVYEGIVCFDWSSYDMEDDIPMIKIGGNEIKVEEFRVNYDGTEIVIISGFDSYTLDLTNSPYSEEDYEDMGIYTLLNNVYYETDYSWEIGDFELDFLGINN